MCKICSKLKVKTPERRRSGAFIVNFEHILHIVLVLLLLTLNYFSACFNFLKISNKNIQAAIPVDIYGHYRCQTKLTD